MLIDRPHRRGLSVKVADGVVGTPGCAWRNANPSDRATRGKPPTLATLDANGAGFSGVPFQGEQLFGARSVAFDDVATDGHAAGASLVPEQHIDEANLVAFLKGPSP